jgi:hypothetical protein
MTTGGSRGPGVPGGVASERGMTTIGGESPGGLRAG